MLRLWVEAWVPETAHLSKEGVGMALKLPGLVGTLDHDLC